jgi:hypothetical protein
MSKSKVSHGMLGRNHSDTENPTNMFHKPAVADKLLLATCASGYLIKPMLKISPDHRMDVIP